MILMGYDASVFNAVQVSPNWIEHFNSPNEHWIGLLNTTYTVGGIVTGWFFAGPIVRNLILNIAVSRAGSPDNEIVRLAR